MAQTSMRGVALSERDDGVPGPAACGSQTSVLAEAQMLASVISEVTSR
jgi:hypothetical protein